MPTAAFANLGCKVNQYEIERIADSFVQRGFDITDFNQPADVYVINSCSVTAAADRKSRQLARRAARQKDGARVVITGCFAQLALDKQETVDGATLVVSNREKMRTAELTLNAFPDLASPNGGFHSSEKTGSIAVFPEQADLLPLSAGRIHARSLERTRETLKVQDGCLHFCAFCSIPYTRSTNASRPVRDVVAEATRHADSGVREVVVTGVCVGAYSDGGRDLADLLAAVSSVNGIERVRLSSLQPIEMTDKLIDVFAEYPSICPHVHLSLQSGDDTVLAAMQRPYSTQFYRELVRRLRAKMPDIAINTDIIVGFPGETDELFENTMRFAAEMQFARTHVFKYSPRQRTFAERNFKDNVADIAKTTRHRELTDLSKQSQTAFARRFVGTAAIPVLIEGRSGSVPGQASGFTREYVRVEIDGAAKYHGQIVRVRITEVDNSAECRGVIEELS
jgi:threonylcarbamoyladenosine tRNA methylthiotransferase MtaB